MCTISSVWRSARPARGRGCARAIAFEVGFGNLSWFNRTFRRKYGASPSDIRKAAVREG
jgi:AraC-like DNA-binding protein